MSLHQIDLCLWKGRFLNENLNAPLKLLIRVEVLNCIINDCMLMGCVFHFRFSTVV